MTSVLVHYNFEDDEDTLIMASFDALQDETVEPPALPFLLRKEENNDDWFARLPEATRRVLENAAQARPEEWDGGERVIGAIAHPIN